MLYCGGASRALLSAASKWRSGLTAWVTCPALLVWFVACAAPKPPPQPDSEALYDDDSAILVPTDQLSRPPFMVLQRVRGKHIGQRVAFECAVELSHGKLTIHGMTPYTPRAFVVEQNGVHVSSQAFMLRDVWFDPVQVLYDIHRAFFRGLTTAQPDGYYEVLDRGEVVRELWENGHVVERSFHSLDTFASLVVIDFKGAPAPVIAPRVRITNLHYSYSLEIEMVEQRRLGSDYSLGVERQPAPRAK
jgi:hypothetical protein